MYSKKSEKFKVIDIFESDYKEIQDFKFHYEFKDIIFCIRLARQRAVHSLMRFNILKCNCWTNNKHYDSTVYFNQGDNDILYACGCDIDKYDVLEDILLNKDNDEK